MKKSVYERAKEFKNKYPLTIAWRLKAHSEIVEKHLNPGEEVNYVFTGQKNDNPLDIITTYVFVLTNKRIIMAQKRLFFGYFFLSITPDMFNDLTVKSRIVWGKIDIDTVKEVVHITNLDKNSLDEIETHISEYMLKEKGKKPKAD